MLSTDALVKGVVPPKRYFRIKPKRDFCSNGFWIKGRWVRSGFVVIGDVNHPDAGCNVMPGACWFMTIREALHGIRCLVAADGSADKFWDLVRQERPGTVMGHE
jgi:hypothetical protein